MIEKKHPEERRLVTVLFADVLGFTTLADQLDFEVVSDLVQGVWLKLDQVIEKHGGYIDKHIGDAFMVIWGAPQAREDDADRAVTAGLEILSALEEYKTDSGHAAAKQLQLRVGIHSGLALTGYVGLRGEYTVMGNTVNIAKRLEEMAEPGTVYISDATYHFVRGGYRIRKLNPMQLKGIEDLLQAYQVLEPLRQPSKLRYHSMGGLETNLVAREQQLIELKRIYNNTRRQKKPSLALVTGGAGLGKSRLIMEFVSQVEVENPALTVMSSRGLQQTKQVPFYLWKELWFNRFDLSDDDPADEAREKIVEGVLELWGKQLGEISAIETAHFLGEMIGVRWTESPYLEPYLDDIEMRKQHSFELHRELLSRASRAGPLILVLDDLQWADRSSLALVAFLLEQTSQPLPLLILGGARPQIYQHAPDLAQAAEEIELPHLPIDGEIVKAAYPALNEASERLLSELAQRAEGNPYYLEELVKRLFQTGYDITSEEDISHILPPSLQLLLQSRLDGLSPQSRATALFAAVVGRVFWKGAVMNLFRDPSDVTGIFKIKSRDLSENVEDSLQELTRAEMAFPRIGSAFSGEKEYIFKHSLLRDVAYRLIPRKYRAQCHLSVANWLASRAGLERSVSVAGHFEKAGEMDMACAYYRKAAQYARSQGNIREALDFEQHANHLASGTGTT